MTEVADKMDQNCKKPYVRPQLIVAGDIASLTEVKPTIFPGLGPGNGNGNSTGLGNGNGPPSSVYS
jgi:hypothetical protein